MGTSVAAGILQLMVVPLALRFVALRYIHLGIPIVHFVKQLHSDGIAFTSKWNRGVYYFKALDYSVFRAAKELFYMLLSYDSRYRAKQLLIRLGIVSRKAEVQA